MLLLDLQVREKKNLGFKNATSFSFYVFLYPLLVE